MKRILQRIILCIAFLSIMLLLPKNEVNAASKRLFNIVVKDGFTTQTIEMKYGKSQYGYNTYYANQSVIYVNAKAKRVTFQVKKNTSSRYGNFSFSAKSMKPGNKAKNNLFTYTVDGKTRAWLFSVQKITDPEIKYLKLVPSASGKNFITGKKKTLQIKTRVVTEIPTKVKISVLNEEGKTVYQKSYASAGTKTYKINWNGKPSKNNKAKLKTKSYVPDGNYTVRVTVTMAVGKDKKVYTKEKPLCIGKVVEEVKE